VHQILTTLLTIVFFSCNSPSAEDLSLEVVDSTAVALDTVQAEILVDSSRLIDLQYFRLPGDNDYASVKQSISVSRTELQSSNPLVKEMQAAFEKALLHRIIPFWEGTSWTFEGHTSRPQVGSIACGYFVSTTLKHARLEINRYKLAQQSPINEARSLALKSEIIEIAEGSVIKNIKAIQAKIPAGIHFIGFDQNHVGYLLKNEDGLYLIHSNYVEIRGVEIEQIEASSVFPFYERFYIVPLSTNENFLKAWLSGEVIDIVTG